MGRLPVISISTCQSGFELNSTPQILAIWNSLAYFCPSSLGPREAYHSAMCCWSITTHRDILFPHLFFLYTFLSLLLLLALPVIAPPPILVTQTLPLSIPPIIGCHQFYEINSVKLESKVIWCTWGSVHWWQPDLGSQYLAFSIQASPHYSPTPKSSAERCQQAQKSAY